VKPGHDFKTTVSRELDGKEIVYKVLGHVTDYYPAVMYKKNGDPGDPEEGGEVELDQILDEEGQNILDCLYYEDLDPNVKGGDTVYDFIYHEVCSQEGVYEYDEPEPPEEEDFD
jgi:hypothetical protein